MATAATPAAPVDPMDPAVSLRRRLGQYYGGTSDPTTAPSASSGSTAPSTTPAPFDAAGAGTYRGFQGNEARTTSGTLPGAPPAPPITGPDWTTGPVGPVKPDLGTPRPYTGPPYDIGPPTPPAPPEPYMPPALPTEKGGLSVAGTPSGPAYMLNGGATGAATTPVGPGMTTQHHDDGPTPPPDDGTPPPGPPPEVGPPPPPAAPPPPPPPPPPAPTPGRTDADHIRSIVQQWMGGNNPQHHQDAEYWVRRIIETGGLGDDNMGYWQGRFTEAPGTHPAESPAPSGGGGGIGGSGLTQPPGLWNQDFINQLRTMITGRMQQDMQPVDENSDQFRIPLEAARNEAARSSEQERKDLAEHLYAQGGLNTNAITQGIQQSAERNATGLGSLRASLITNEYKARRTELQGLMSMSLAAGDAEMARNVQLQIAALDAAIRREGLGVQLAISGQNNNNAAVNG